MSEGPEIQIDVLRHIEKLTEEINRTMAGPGRSALKRYPLTFTLLALFGVVAVSEGIKGVLASLGIFEGHPWYMLVAGIVVLIVTGTLYKKLDKEEVK